MFIDRLKVAIGGLMKNIGIDIVKLERFRDFLGDRKKYGRILSEKEIAVFERFVSEKRRLEYLAGRFAAKEAVIKATSGLGRSFSFSDLSVLNDEKGAPYLDAQVFNDLEILLTISHTDTDAVAIALVK